MTWGLSCRCLSDIVTQMKGGPGAGAFLQNGLMWGRVGVGGGVAVALFVPH